MKKLLISLLFVPLSLFAKENPFEPFCTNLDSLKTILSEFEEIPFARGLSNRDGLGFTSFVIFVNPKTSSWSVVEKIADNRYCFIAIGSSFEPVPNEILEKFEEERKSKIL